MNVNYKPILSDYYKSLNLFLKKTAKEIPCKSIKERTQNFINFYAKFFAQNEKYEPEKAMASAVEMSAFIQDLNKNLPHIFIEDDNLISFLKEMEVKDNSIAEGFVKNTDSPYLLNELSDNAINNKSVFDMLEAKTLNTSYYALHSVKESYLIVTIRDERVNDKIQLFIFNDEKDYSNLSLNFTDRDLDFLKQDSKARLAVNFLAYINAFPECLQNRNPDNITTKDKSIYKNTKTLKTSESVLEIENDKSYTSKVITPHFRKGHFRYLKDERFVNKKGQIIFVKAAMVRGHAKTLENKNISKSKNNFEEFTR